jgi:hypothetical protein
MPPYRSYLSLYWRTWTFAIAIYVASTFIVGSSTKFLSTFAFITFFGAVFVFAFEFSRLKSFLSVSFPQIRETFPTSIAFSFFTFFHPFLWREVLHPKASEGKPYADAYAIFRAAYFFSAIVLAVPFILNLAFLWRHAA